MPVSDLFKNVTAEQIGKTVRTAVQVGGVLLCYTYGFDQSQVAAAGAKVVTATDALISAGGAVMVAGTFIYGLWTSRPHGIIAQAAALPQVQEIAAKRSTAEAIPSPKVVPTVT